jgi:hypothetical protein
MTFMYSAFKDHCILCKYLCPLLLHFNASVYILYYTINLILLIIAIYPFYRLILLYFAEVFVLKVLL